MQSKTPTNWRPPNCWQVNYWCFGRRAVPGILLLHINELLKFEKFLVFDHEKLNLSLYTTSQFPINLQNDSLPSQLCEDRKAGNAQASQIPRCSVHFRILRLGLQHSFVWVEILREWFISLLLFLPVFSSFNSEHNTNSFFLSLCSPEWTLPPTYL